MPPTDLPGGPPDPGFVALAVPARSRLHLRHVPLAPRYADYTPGDGPRLGWPRPIKWIETIDGHHIVWCGERRSVARLPENLAALTITARLGRADLADRIGLRGDLLITGIDTTGGPADVPRTVIQAAARAGLLTNTDHGGAAGEGRSLRARPGAPAAALAGRRHLHDPHTAAVAAQVEAGTGDPGSGRAPAAVWPGGRG